MALAAKALGLDYLAITEHSRRLTVAHGLDPLRLAASARKRTTCSIRGRRRRCDAYSSARCEALPAGGARRVRKLVQAEKSPRVDKSEGGLHQIATHRAPGAIVHTGDAHAIRNWQGHLPGRVPVLGRRIALAPRPICSTSRKALAWKKPPPFFYPAMKLASIQSTRRAQKQTRACLRKPWMLRSDASCASLERLGQSACPPEPHTRIDWMWFIRCYYQLDSTPFLEQGIESLSPMNRKRYFCHRTGSP